MTFGYLCEFVGKLEQDTRRAQLVKTDFYTRQHLSQHKYERVARFFREYRALVGDDIYPVMRLLFPADDRTRTFGIKDKTLADVVLKIFSIDRASEPAFGLTKWKASTHNRSASYSQVVVDFVCARVPQNSGNVLTISDVNSYLDEYYKLSLGTVPASDGAATSTSDARCQLTRELIHKMGRAELQCFFAILLKARSIIPYKKSAFFNIWHRDAHRLYLRALDLQYVFHKLRDPNYALSSDDLDIQVSRPFAPQLSTNPSRLRALQSYDAIVRHLNRDFYIEEKVDGERILIHYDDFGRRIKFYTRRGTDYTYLYGNSVEGDGGFAPYLRNCIHKNVRSVILDGEMVSYDPVRKVVLPFGILKGVLLMDIYKQSLYKKGNASDDEEPLIRPLFKCFDLLLVNEKSVIDQPLFKRKEFLAGILKPAEGIIEILPYHRCSTADSITNAVKQVVELGSEGIMLKRCDLIYKVGHRSEFSLKLKPEYLEEFGENVDLIVIGREPSKKTSYFCGLKDGDKFLSFCKIANGIDSKMSKEIETLTAGKWRKFSPSETTGNVEFGKLKPMEWIDPADSVVIEVKARSVNSQDSSRYRTNTTLYNAYATCIRHDKDHTTATTVEDYKQLKKSHKTDVDAKEQKMTKLKKKQRDKIERLMGQESFYCNTTPKDSIFSGLTFLVLSDGFINKQRYSIDDLSKLVISHGGRVIKDETKYTHSVSKLRIISDKLTIQVNYLAKKGFDILKSNYIFKSVKMQRVVRVEPTMVLKGSEELAKLSSTRVDKYGDSYEVFVNQEELSGFSFKVDSGKTINDMNELNLFNNLSFYVLKKDEIKYNNLVQMIEINGGTITDSLGECFIVVSPQNPTSANKSEIVKLRKLMAEQVGTSHSTSLNTSHNTSHITTNSVKRIVTYQWVFQSISQNCLVDEEKYQVVV